MRKNAYLLLLIMFTNTPCFTSTKQRKQDPHNLFNQKKPLSILIVAPHPDDDIIACGGSIIKHVQADNHVAIAYMTSGEKGYVKKDISHSLATKREQEATTATTHLGVTDLTFLKLPDGEVTDNQASINSMAILIRSKKPDIIYAPHRLDKHLDHIATSSIVTQAIAMAANVSFTECSLKPHKIKKVFYYEVWTPLQNPSYAEDISLMIDKKLEALRFHASQLNNKKYDDGILGLNRYRSVMTGIGTYAECFDVVSYKH